jgi:transposase
MRVLGVELVSGGWVVSAVGEASGFCPGCGNRSTRRHGWHRRDLHDLPVQGLVVTLKLGVSRWRCLSTECERQTFVDQLPAIARPHARRTRRVSDIVQLLGHAVGGLPGERLMNCLGIPASDDTIVRLLKMRASARATTAVRVAGIDDWNWRKGCTYGTIVVDLERREVVDVLPERSTAGTAQWLSQHPEIEIISRDRGGLYAKGARQGASQARQIADRVHLLQNLGETIETQLSRGGRSTGRALLPASKQRSRTREGKCMWLGGSARSRGTPAPYQAGASSLATSHL